MSDELDDGARDLIARALREETRANPATLAKIRRRVLASALVVSSAGGTAQAAGAAGKAWLAVFTAPVTKALVAGSLAVGGAATIAATLPERQAVRAPAVVGSAQPGTAPSPPRAATGADAVPGHFTTPAAPENVQVDPLPVQAPGPAVAATSEALAARAAKSAASPSSEPVGESRRPSLSEELAVLREAQARLNAGDGKAALRLLDETAVAHGGGQLGVERAAVEILAACGAGELQRARRLARGFLAAYPNVPAAARVRASCAGEGH